MLKFFTLTTLALIAGLSAPARAYCVVNGASVPVHAQSLDASGMVAEIEPGARFCTGGKDGGRMASILVVTDFRPVGQKGARPGWRAECRADVPAAGWVEVSGERNRIACRTHAVMPEEWKN